MFRGQERPDLLLHNFHLRRGVFQLLHLLHHRRIGLLLGAVCSLISLTHLLFEGLDLVAIGFAERFHLRFKVTTQRAHLLLNFRRQRGHDLFKRAAPQFHVAPLGGHASEGALFIVVALRTALLSESLLTGAGILGNGRTAERRCRLGAGRRGGGRGGGRCGDHCCRQESGTCDEGRDDCRS